MTKTGQLNQELARVTTVERFRDLKIRASKERIGLYQKISGRLVADVDLFEKDRSCAVIFFSEGNGVDVRKPKDAWDSYRFRALGDDPDDEPAGKDYRSGPYWIKVRQRTVGAGTDYHAQIGDDASKFDAGPDVMPAVARLVENWGIKEFGDRPYRVEFVGFEE